MFRQDEKDYIVSLYDFSTESDVALNHATLIAGATGNEVQLLHIINSETKSKLKKVNAELHELRRILDSVAAKNEQETGVPTTFHTVEGNIFTTISDHADDLNAALIVMGTPGVKGMQHLLGANSMRVILSSGVPVIVVQKRKAEYHGYKKILIPIDYSKFGKNKVDSAVALAKYYQSEVILFKSGEKDPYLAEIVRQNLSYANFLLKIDDIPSTLVEENMEEGTFSRQVIELAIEKQVDLIVISSEHRSDSIKDLMMGIHEVDIINNEGEIAVMCVNPLDDPDDISE
jgi:nucleotide-binding universal stress UspA family protein